MPNIRRISTLQYLGSKSRMLDDICTPIINNSNINKVVDLFAGTGSVGFALSPYKSIVSNDIEYYSYVLNEAILNGCMITNEELDILYGKIDQMYQIREDFLHKEIDAEKNYLSAPLDEYQKYADFSNNTPSVFNKTANIQVFASLNSLVKMITPGKNVQNVPFPCLFVTYFANAYFGIKQCCQIDAIVSAILELHDTRQRYVLLSALMSATSITSSSTTHFAQFLTVKNKSTFKNIKEKRSTSIIGLFKDAVSKFSNSGLLDNLPKNHKCFNLNYKDCLENICIDEHTLIYADPPYFKEHYSRYYHVLNTMCRYDYPDLAINPQSKEYSIGRYRADRNISDFGKRSKALSAFDCLINTCADKKANLVISYSENSIVKIEELLQLAMKRYDVKVDKITLKHSSQGRATESDQNVKEFLFLCSLPDNLVIDVEKAAKKIKEIKPIVDNPGGFIHNYMARKPYNVISAIIDVLSKPGDVIYDPMFGSGTTLIEASKLGRRAIGADINPIANQICSISLRKWDLTKINQLIDKFVMDVDEACSNIYAFLKNGEERIIERCHFDYMNNELIPKEYWYKTKIKGKLTGRKKSDVSTDFCENYVSYSNTSLANLCNHPLMTNSRIAIKENATVFSYFCHRNLVALDRIMGLLEKYKSSYGYEVLQLLVSSSVNLIKLSDKKASSQMPYWLPKKNATSRNAVFIIQQKAVAMKEGLEYLQTNCRSFVDTGDVQVFCTPAQTISKECLADSSVDLVLTDPPYTDQVPYLEYNQLWLYLFGMEKMFNFEDELVVSDAPSRHKDHQNFSKVFNEIVQRTARCLKENGLFVMFYHTFDLKSWANLLSVMQTNHLRYTYQIPTASPRKSFKTVMSPKSTLDGNYLLFFIKDDNIICKQFTGSIIDAVSMVETCARKIIQSNEHVTTQDLYDLGILKDAFEEGYLQILSQKYKTFADVIKGKFKYEDGYWEEKK